MINTKKYVIRKVIVIATSILIGVTTDSFETIYAQQASENNKLSDLNSIDSKSIGKSEKVENTISSEDKLLGEIIKEKIDWNLIDKKEFLNYLLSGIKVDKNKEREIKNLWLVKVNEMLITHSNNENLQKIKNILEEDLEEDNKNKEINADSKSENKDVVKETPKKEIDSGKGKEVSKEEQNDKDKKETELMIQKNILTSKLSNHDISVSFDKNKINADSIFVASISDKKLDKEIIDKLGDEYKIVEIFEIYFKKDGKKISSDGERTIKVPVSKNDSTELEVYHITENNILEKVESSYSEGVLQFNINHFSKFTILERIRVRAKDLESRTQIMTQVKANYEESKGEIYSNTDRSSKKVENNKKEMEKLPGTGLESETAVSMVLLALVAIILIRRKQVR
ncbi:hypothetical protein ACWOBP_02645 [Gemella parahaemolysans]|nr:MAG TPA: hypothetical protein [Caudoviricetes sp.]